MRFDPFKAATSVFNIAKSISTFQVILNETSGDPHLLQNVFKMEEALDGTPHGKKSIQFQMENEDLRKLWEEKWMPERIDLNKLKILPEGSLGRLYAENLIRQGFSPDALLDLDPYPITNQKEFLIHRTWQVHDLAHALLGFDGNSEGELGLQAFEYSQTQSPHHLFMMFGVLFRFNGLFDGGLDFHQSLLSIARGFNLGVHAKKMLNSVKLEEQMHRPINDIRNELGLPTKENTSQKYIEASFYDF